VEVIKIDGPSGVAQSCLSHWTGGISSPFATEIEASETDEDALTEDL
jgi:hypothetical protein